MMAKDKYPTHIFQVKGRLLYNSCGIFQSRDAFRPIACEQNYLMDYKDNYLQCYNRLQATTVKGFCTPFNSIYTLCRLQYIVTWCISFWFCTLSRSPPIGCWRVSSWSARAIQSIISCKSISSWRHSVPVSSRRSRISSVRTLRDCHLSIIKRA